MADNGASNSEEALGGTGEERVERTEQNNQQLEMSADVPSEVDESSKLADVAVLANNSDGKMFDASRTIDLEVPPQFDKPWRLSDIIIRTNNSEGKDIHACKTMLAVWSPYFHAFFFGGYEKKNDAPVVMDCDYDVALEILRNMHQIGYKYNVAPKPYQSEMLVKLYMAADLYDFAFIRRMCLDHMEGYTSVDTFIAAAQLQLVELRTQILMKLTKEDLDELLRRSNFDGGFTKEEFLFLYSVEAGKPLPKSTEDVVKTPNDPLKLEEIAADLENPRVDLTQSWRTANLAIIADNANGKILYANEAVVEMMCNNNEYLRKMYKENMKINEEYAAMKEILSIIHRCDMNYKPKRVLHPALIHAMHYAADENRLDIPLVRKFCVDMLADQKSIDAVDVLCRLDPNPLPDSSLVEMLNELSTAELRDWIYRKDEHLSYRKGELVYSVTHSQKEPLIWRSLACDLIDKFKTL